MKIISQKSLAVFALIILVITIIVSLFILKKPARTKFSPSSTPSQPLISKPSPLSTANLTNLNSIPPLPSKFSWKKVSPSQTKSLYNRIAVSKGLKISQEALLEGETWVAKLKQVSSNEFNPHEDLIDYYHSKLEKIGWDWSKESSEYKLSAVDSDGPNGSTTGYIGIRQDKMRMINVSYNVTFFNDKTLIRDAEYWVFVSNIIPLEHLLTQSSSTTSPPQS